PANVILRDPNTSGFPTLYVGNDVGVYQGTTANGQAWTWTRYDAGLPNVQVLDLQLHKYPDGTSILAAATDGRGAWTTTVPQPAAAGRAGAIIDNGTIKLGVHREADLNVDGGIPSSGGTGTPVVGIR